MKFALLTISVFLTFGLFAQSNWSVGDKQLYRDASNWFEEGDFPSAMTAFRSLFAKDSTMADLQYKLGACELQAGQKERALSLLSRAEKQGVKAATFEKGVALHRLYRFEEAIQHFEKYFASGDKTYSVEHTQYHMDCSKRAIVSLATPVDVAITNVGPGINTSWKEYVPVITPDGKNIYFTSRRPDSTARLKDDNGEYFEDVYHATKDSTGWNKAINIGQPVNSETHDATVSISADGKTMIIYRTNENLTGGDLYLTTFKGGKWSKPEKLNDRINSNYQEASASLSPDKQILYFSSNRPGGYGGKDLYRVRRLPNGEWSLPKNLGPSINTAYDEDAPYMDADGITLYFASKGHTTIGGYDLFRSTRTEEEVWTQPENLGYPVNTVDDDIFLAVDKGGKIGYFASERPGGYGALDIYSIDFIYRQNEIIIVHGEVRATNEFPVGAEITLIDENTHKIQGVYRSNPNNGKFILDVHPLIRYKVIVEAPGYKTTSEEFEFDFPLAGEAGEAQLTPFMLRKE
ncbi:MAG: peptidoglycan-associated lipoprotein OmpA family [Bacteroidota bacterium]